MSSKQYGKARPNYGMKPKPVKVPNANQQLKAMEGQLLAEVINSQSDPLAKLVLLKMLK